MDRTGVQSAQGAGRAGGWRLAVLCLLLALPVALARGEDAYQIKAAFIFNFTKFITWPAAMEQEGGDLRLCLFNGNPFGDYVFQLEGRKVRNFYLRVVQPKSSAELGRCHILYLVPDETTSQLLAGIADKPVLTIADEDGFATDGGGIQLLSENNRIRFDVNLQRIKGSGLDISSKLLHLARQVM